MCGTEEFGLRFLDEDEKRELRSHLKEYLVEGGLATVEQISRGQNFSCPEIAPIVKWAGGKRQLLPTLKPMLPGCFNKYFEPFFGGGALFCSMAPNKAVINDLNGQLITMYKQIRDNPSAILGELHQIQFRYNALETMDEKDNLYYELREEYNRRISKRSEDVAALLIFLNKAGFNGLYRVNSMGRYNVPPAHRKQINAFDEKNVMAFSKILKNSEIMCGDFEDACKDAKEGDFVFFDSPYYNTFDTYQAKGFSEEDHVRLRDLFRALTKRKIWCMLTNNDCEQIKELYKGFNIRSIPVKRVISCNGKNRTGKEVIITNY